MMWLTHVILLVHISRWCPALGQELCLPDRRLSRSEVNMLKSISCDLVSKLNVDSWEKDKYRKIVYDFMAKHAPDNPDIMSEIARIQKAKHYNSFMDEKPILHADDESEDEETVTTDDDEDKDEEEKDKKDDEDKDNRRIFNGMKASNRDWPFIVSINVYGHYICAGAIIKSYLVLTAASCVKTGFKRNIVHARRNVLSVRAGSNSYNTGGTSIDVATVMFHPQFDEETLQNNISILKLKHQIPYSQSTNEIEVGAVRGRKVQIAGWGLAKSNIVPDGSRSDVLKYAVLNVIDLSSCKYFFPQITEENFCGTSSPGGGGACKYDVGGPAVMDDVLVGIISLVYPLCGQPGTPSVFTNLAHHVHWINRVIRKTSRETKISVRQKPKGSVSKRVKSTDKYPTILKTIKKNMTTEHGKKNILTKQVLKALRSHKNDGALYEQLLSDILRIIFPLISVNVATTTPKLHILKHQITRTTGKPRFYSGSSEDGYSSSNGELDVGNTSRTLEINNTTTTITQKHSTVNATLINNTTIKYETTSQQNKTTAIDKEKLKDKSEKKSLRDFIDVADQDSFNSETDSNSDEPHVESKYPIKYPMEVIVDADEVASEKTPSHMSASSNSRSFESEETVPDEYVSDDQSVNVVDKLHRTPPYMLHQKPS